jgi:phage-related tail fiber protein
MPQPKLLSKPWASDGLKNNIPAERNGGLAQEAATYAEGFPSITMTPISVGGKPPSGKDMNGVLYEISAHTVWQNQGGRYRFDRTFCDAIGGYPKGSVLINDTLDTEYISLVDANTHNPNSGNNTGKWAIHAGKGLKASTAQAGSVQLSSATNSDREDMAATSKAVKTAYDKAVAAESAADGAVKTRGAQEIGGVKTFTSKAVFNGGLSVSGNEKSADIHTGPADIYLRNSKSNKYLQLKDDGTLTYSDVKIALMSDKSDAVNLDSSDRLATSKAVKTAYDNSIRRGGAVGLGGQNHQIAIGWDTPGLVARVDNNVMNVGVPVGAVAYFAQDVPPFGWLKANGAAVSRTVYANLFAAIGERYGRGDGRTTFNLPDLRGEFIRSWDDGRAIDRNRVLGSWQADEFRSHSHGIGVNRMSDTDRGSSPSTVSVDTVGQTDPAGGIETRPRNIALLACIKA